jgi:hypothetical protein
LGEQVKFVIYERRAKQMTRLLKTGLIFPVMILFAAVLIHLTDMDFDRFNFTKAAEASETNAVAGVQESPERELRQLMLERKMVLSNIVDSMKIFVDSGRFGLDEYIDANIALLRAEMDLSKTKDERLNILEKIIQFHKKYEEHVAKMIAIGQSTEIGLNKAKVAVLDAQIELVREKLKLQSTE